MDENLHYRKIGNIVLPPDLPDVRGIEVSPRLETLTVPDMRIRGEERKMDDTVIRSRILEKNYMFSAGESEIPPVHMPEIRMTKDPTMMGVVKKSLSEDANIRIGMLEDIQSKYPTRVLPPMRMAEDPRTKLPDVFLPPYLKVDMPELPRMEMKEHYEPIVETVYPDIKPDDWRGLTASTSPYGAFGIYEGRAFGEFAKAISI